MKSKYKTATIYGNWVIFKNNKAFNNNQTLNQLQKDEILIHELLEVCKEALRHHQGGHSEIGHKLRDIIEKATKI